MFRQHGRSIGRRAARALAAGLVLPALSLLASACGTGKAPAGRPAGAVEIQLKEFAIEPKVVSAGAGEITLTARNVGSTEHNLVLEQGDRSVAEIPVVGVGKAESVQVKLSPGTYALVCTLPGHRDAGMVATLTVQ